MSTTRDVRPFEPSGQRRELVRLVRQIQALTLEVHELQQRQGRTPELHARERRLEQLRWRLAAAPTRRNRRARRRRVTTAESGRDSRPLRPLRVLNPRS